jgi:hypothetical protein
LQPSTGHWCLLGGIGTTRTMLIRALDPAADAALLPGLAAMMVEAVAGGASIGFMAGFGQADALHWWRAWLAAGQREALVAIDGRGVAGTVSLVSAAMPIR